MVCVRDVSLASGVQYLVILDDENQHVGEGTTLVVFEPLTGKYAKTKPKLLNPLYKGEWSLEHPLSKTSKVRVLQSSHHQLTNEPTPLPTLGRRIIEGQNKWENDTRFLGEFHYVKGYWEWTEDILSRCEDSLEAATIYSSVYASLCIYDCNIEIIKAFCEAWCPLTNTLLTSFGELSISLWDVHKLAGFPMIGNLYDEVIPSAKELNDVDEARSVLRSCKYLLHAYHLLRHEDESSRVSVEAWIKFWSRKVIKYHQPPQGKEKKSAQYPFGDLEKPKAWAPAEISSFARLGMRQSERKETYLAAYSACWLCVFVLPDDDVKFIRPSTFKMASTMASGRKLDLTTPVLASIYRGLNKIAKSSRPPQTCSAFPIHFVYAWISHYFKTHKQVWQGVRKPEMMLYSGEGNAKNYDPREARKRVHKGDFASWTCFMMTSPKDTIYVDDGHVEDHERLYFAAMRSNYLPLRQGDHFIIEPYSPHRFSRQFGFYQVLLGALTRDVREASLEDGVRYWRLCTLSRSMSKVWLPSMPVNVKKFSSNDYKKWWTNAHGNFLEDNIARLIESKTHDAPLKEHIDRDIVLSEKNASSSHAVPFCERRRKSQSSKHVEEQRKSNSHFEESSSDNDNRNWKRTKKDHNPSKSVGNIASAQDTKEYARKLEKEIFGIDYDEEPQGSQDSIVGPSSQVKAPPSSKTTQKKPISKQIPRHAAISTFEGVDFIRDRQRGYLQSLWCGISEKIAKTPIDVISSIQDNVFLVLEEMKSFNKFDVSNIAELLNAFFSKATTYDEARSKSSEKASTEPLARQLSEAKDRLHNAKAKESKEFDQLQSAKAELGRIQKELDKLEEKKKKLSASLEKRQQLLDDVQTEVRDIEEEIVSINNTSPLNDDMVADLEGLKLDLEAAQEELKNLNPFA